jgi:predicted amidohydrolase
MEGFMNHKHFKLAMGQMLVEGAAIDNNMNRAETLIKKASEACCSIIVLPECLDIGWSNPGALQLAEPIPGKISNKLCTAALTYKIYVAAGITERDGDKIYNAAVFISPEGEILLKHRKINILTDVEGIYSVGNFLSVVETPLGVIGIDICADNFPNSLVFGHALARMGAELILSPCAWAVKPEHDNTVEPYGDLWEEAYSSLCRLYDISIVGVSNVGWVHGGPWDNWKCIGCSLAVGPGGTILSKAPYGENAEKLVIIDIKLRSNKVRGTEFGTMLQSKGYIGP